MARLDVALVLQSWRRLKAHGAYPVSGGQDEQAATFLAAVDILDAAFGLWERREHQRQMRKAKRGHGKARA